MSHVHISVMLTMLQKVDTCVEFSIVAYEHPVQPQSSTAHQLSERQMCLLQMKYSLFLQCQQHKTVSTLYRTQTAHLSIISLQVIHQ